MSDMDKNAELRAMVNTPEFKARFFGENLRKASRAALRWLVDAMQVVAAPRRFCEMNIGSFPAGIQDALHAALDSNRGVFIFGRVGGGKSSLAAAAMREIKWRQAVQSLESDWRQRESRGWGPEASWCEAELYIGSALSAAIGAGDMLFKNTAELMDDIKACFNGDGARTKQELVAQYAGVSTLVLDDLGMEKPSEFVRETFDMIVNKRWMDEKTTIITSNLNLAQLDTHYDDHGRIASRIAGMCAVVELVGEDRRTAR